MFPAPVANRPRFGHNNYQRNGHHNFQWRPPQNRPMYLNRNAYFRNQNQQQSYDNSEQYWCETCDRGFNTQDLLEKHKQQHQKCNIDGCQFVAHPKVITKHIQMQHSSGLYKKIAKLNNPEEIKKWIEERKKKYPTKENIEKKSAEIKEKIERGEKMGLRQDRFQRNNSQGQDLKRKSNNNHNQNNQQQHMRLNNVDKLQPQKKKPKKVVQPKKVNTVAVLDETRKLKPFTGIQNIDMDSDTGEETEQPDCNFIIEDDDLQTNSKIEELKFISEPSVCGALSSLMCNYGSSEEENEDVTEVPSKTKQKEQTKTNKVKIKADTTMVDGKDKRMVEDQSKKIVEDQGKIMVEDQGKKMVEDNNKSDDDSGPEEVKVVKAVDVPSPIVATNSDSVTNPANNKFRKKDNIREHNRFIRPKPKVPSTLLHKLLHREVQHERNVILQCVRYIVKNNYFEK